MAEFFETRNKYVEKSMPQVLLEETRKRRKGSKKRKDRFLDNSEDKDSHEETSGGSFVISTARADIQCMNTQH